MESEHAESPISSSTVSSQLNEFRLPLRVEIIYVSMNFLNFVQMTSNLAEMWSNLSFDLKKYAQTYWRWTNSKFPQNSECGCFQFPPQFLIKFSSIWIDRFSFSIHRSKCLINDSKPQNWKLCSFQAAIEQSCLYKMFVIEPRTSKTNSYINITNFTRVYKVSNFIFINFPPELCNPISDECR